MFLEKVAQDILSRYGTNLARTAVVFPNKRAAIFMNDYLAHMAAHPIWSPSYISISDLFRKHSDIQVGDNIKLICELHKAYQETTHTQEPLDSFYGWGALLLADFDDIDKHMADAHKVFSVVENLHELDDISYLTPQQRQMLAQFFSNFNDDHDSELKKRFLRFWKHLANIYDNFNQRLSRQGLAYEGALYRQVATDDTLNFEFERYIFVGFNMLHEVEMKLFDRLKQQGKAHFYWDYDAHYMAENEAGHFIRRYMEYYPNELPAEEPSDSLYQSQDVSFISAQTEDIQARYANQWLNQQGRLSDGRRTAIVMCNEGLLTTVIHCLPEDTKVNVTTGYPLQQTTITSLVYLLTSLQVNGQSSDGSFRMHFLRKIDGHPYAPYLPELGKPIEQSSFFNLQLLSWLADILQHIGRQFTEASPMEQESVFRMYTLINRMKQLVESGDLIVESAMLLRLLRQIINTTSIPFHGEPAEGIQVMGVLETRNLDFDHLLILSCNEGNMPRGTSDASFIPYNVRKAYDLTTTDHQVAIYSYYFYRLISKARDITILYNASTEDGQQGEMSRFMIQLMVEHLRPKRYTLQGMFQSEQSALPQSISNAKVPTDANGHVTLSPTAINRYLRCPLQFYFYTICGLLEPDDDDPEHIDNRLFGNIFHRAAELSYIQIAPPEAVEADEKGYAKLARSFDIRKADIEALLHQPQTIERIVDQAFCEENAKKGRGKGSNRGTEIINRRVIASYLRRLLQLDTRLAPFRILGLEMPVSLDLSPQISLTIAGFIDRLDQLHDGTIRVIDYKTGRQPNQFPHDIDEVFDPANVTKKHSDYYLQSMLYSYIITQRPAANTPPASSDVTPALLFIQRSAAADYDPTLHFGRETIVMSQHAEAFREHLLELLNEITDQQRPFFPTPDEKRCDTCPYRRICHVAVGIPSK